MDARSSRGARVPRQRMSLDDRAKIFVPFDPLEGFRAALREKEREVEEAALDEREGEPPESSYYVVPDDF